MSPNFVRCCCCIAGASFCCCWSLVPLPANGVGAPDVDELPLLVAEAPDEQSPPVDDALLHALLGALYLRKKVVEVAERWAVEEAPSTSLTPDDGAPFTGEILR